MYWNLVFKRLIFLWLKQKRVCCTAKHSRKLQEPTYPFSLNLIFQIEVIYVQSVCIVTILLIKSFKSSKILTGCIAHLTLLPMLKRENKWIYNKFWLIWVMKCSDIEHSFFKTNAPEKLSRAQFSWIFLTSSLQQSQHWQFNRKKKVSKVSNKKGTLNGIKYSLSPFFTFWFHQDTLLKHLSTLTFFHTCDKKAWVGGERNSQKKPEWGKSSFN